MKKAFVVLGLLLLPISHSISFAGVEEFNDGSVRVSDIGFRVAGEVYHYCAPWGGMDEFMPSELKHQAKGLCAVYNKSELIEEKRTLFTTACVALKEDGSILKVANHHGLKEFVCK